MDLTTLEKYALQCIYAPTLCHWMQWQSAYQWQRVAFTHGTGIVSIYETTVTQNLIYEFCQFAASGSLDIALFEANDEKTNGNDLEIFVHTSRGYILLPTQAKIVYRNYKYSAIDHGAPGNYQIEKLIRYASNPKKKGIAFYLLYNFYRPYPALLPIVSSMGVPEYLLGCTMVSAEYIKSKFFGTAPPARFLSIPSFADLHPTPAFPWHWLGCPNEQKRFLTMIDEMNVEIKYYTREEIFEDQEWRNLTPAPRIGYITQDDARRIEIAEGESNEFRPKFRMVFSHERRESRLMRLM